MRHIFLVIALLACLGLDAKDRLGELPQIKYSTSPAVVNGQVKGYKAESGIKSVTFSFTVFTDSERKTIEAPIGNDGRFRAELQTYYTDRVDMHWADTVITFVVVPAEEMTLTINPDLVGVAAAKRPAFEFTGSIGDFNTDLVRYASQYEAIEVIKSIQGEEGMKSLKGLTVMEYRDKVVSLYDEAARRIDADKRICGAFKQYVKATYKYQIVIKTLLYNTTLMVANDTDTPYKQPEGYYGYLATFQPFASTAYLYTMHPAQAVATANLFGNYAGQELQMPSSAEPIRKALKYASSVSELNLLTDDEIASLNSECPELAPIILRYNDDLKARIEAAKQSTEYKICSIDAELKGDDVFKALIAPYKGKPLLVDFWATWCGPCRAAMETIKPVKAELNGKANFIYITSPSSPKRAWELTIPDIHGDHYYVTDEQYSTLLNQFESQSIPTYVTVDSNGNIVNHYIGYPGNDVIKADLSK